MLEGIKEQSEESIQASGATVRCDVPGCRSAVPEPLVAERLCLMHFTDAVEQASSRMRREAASGLVNEEYREKSASSITEYGVLLARVATGGLPVPDPLKKRILSTLLTLMILRESLSRSAHRVVCIRRSSDASAA